MFTKIKYVVGAFIAIPFLPIMYWQGKRIRKNVPKLPEASGSTGIAGEEHLPIIHLLLLGESTIAGVGVATHEEGFAGTLAKELSRLYSAQIVWTVQARSGYTLQKLRKKILPKLAHHRAELIVIGTGANDAFSLNTPFGFQREATAFVEDLRKQFPDVPLFFTNMPPIKSFPAFTFVIQHVLGNLVEILGQTLKRVVTQHPSVFYSEEVIRLATWQKRWSVEGEAGDFFSDGVHPSLLTYQIWAKDMAQFIYRQDALKMQASNN